MIASDPMATIKVESCTILDTAGDEAVQAAPDEAQKPGVSASRVKALDLLEAAIEAIRNGLPATHAVIVLASVDADGNADVTPMLAVRNSDGTEPHQAPAGGRLLDLAHGDGCSVILTAPLQYAMPPERPYAGRTRRSRLPALSVPSQPVPASVRPAWRACAPSCRHPFQPAFSLGPAPKRGFSLAAASKRPSGER